jgi:hypothetical protein
MNKYPLLEPIEQSRAEIKQYQDEKANQLQREQHIEQLVSEYKNASALRRRYIEKQEFAIYFLRTTAEKLKRDAGNADERELIDYLVDFAGYKEREALAFVSAFHKFGMCNSATFWVGY